MLRNWKPLAILAAIATAIVLFTPVSLFGAVPLLFVLACPLSMLLMGGAMMKGMRRDHDRDTKELTS